MHILEDLKLIYRALNKDMAEEALNDLEDKWVKKYPIVTTSWRNNWNNLSFEGRLEGALKL